MHTDYEALDPVTFLPQTLGHHYSLTAEFSDMVTAAHACQELHDAGIPDGDVALLGRLGEEVTTAWGLSADERIVLGTLARRAVLAGAAGAAAIGVLDLLLGLVFIGVNSNVWIAGMAGAVFGSGMGALIAGITTIGDWNSHTDLHRSRPELEDALLGIESEDPVEIDRAEMVLRRLQPVWIDDRQLAGAAR